jgi:hypothetical protein
MRVCVRPLAATAAFLFAVALGGTALADLSAGTELDATLQDALDTKTSRAGDPVLLKVMALVPPAANDVVQGATIKGHVAQATGASPTKMSALRIAFETITLADGRSFAFPGVIESMTKKKRTNYGQAAGEVLAGMFVGNAIGKTMTTKLGGPVGAAGGVMYASQMAQNFRVPQNSTIKIKTTDSIAIPPPRPQAH